MPFMADERGRKRPSRGQKQSASGVEPHLHARLPEDAGSVRSGEATAVATLPRYCSFCWTQLRDGAPECHDCGRTVEEMDAIQAANDLRDQRWVPARQRESTPRPTARPARPAPAPAARPTRFDLGSLHEVRRRWRDLLLAVAAGSFLGAASVSVAWLLILGVNGAAATPSPPEPVASRAAQTASTAPIKPSAAVRVTWSVPHPNLRLLLLGPEGETAARSSGGPATIPPGNYVLRLTDHSGLWKADEPVKLDASTSSLSPKPAATAEYYVWQGKRLHQADRPRGAERLWRSAIQLDPRQVEARLQLAAALAVRFRYREARVLLGEAQRLAPRDERVRRLGRALDELENRR
jgi:hypothetical protein